MGRSDDSNITLLTTYFWSDDFQRVITLAKHSVQQANMMIRTFAELEVYCGTQYDVGIFGV